MTTQKDNTLEILTIKNEILTLTQKCIDLRDSIFDMEQYSIDNPFYKELVKKRLKSEKEILKETERRIKTNKSRLYWI